MVRHEGHSGKAFLAWAAMLQSDEKRIDKGGICSWALVDVTADFMGIKLGGKLIFVRKRETSHRRA